MSMREFAAITGADSTEKDPTKTGDTYNVKMSKYERQKSYQLQIYH